MLLMPAYTAFLVISPTQKTSKNAADTNGGYQIPIPQDQT